MRQVIYFFIIVLFITSCMGNQEVIRKEIGADWQYKEKDTGSWKPANVPGFIHTDLLSSGVIQDPYYRLVEKEIQWIGEKDWIYHGDFYVESSLLKRDNIELCFNGLDTYADVYLNDSLILKADNMFRTWKVECKGLLKPTKNEIKIVFHSPVKVNMKKWEQLPYELVAFESNDQAKIKLNMHSRKAGYHWGWDWGPRLVTSGIWRPVKLLAWDDVRILNLQVIQQELNDDKARLKAVFEIESSGKHNVHLSVIDKKNEKNYAEKAVAVTDGIQKIPVEFEIQNPRRWWSHGLGEAYLYHITGFLKRRNEILDKASTKIGLRTLEIVREPDSTGHSFYVKLNGVPVFMKGANYIPCDNFVTRVTPEKYERVIKAAADANMNMLRVWGGGIYENDIFYDLCDRYGMLVWQDFMFACAMYPGDEAFLNNVEQEAIDNVKRLRNHPCIALWCGNNEMGSGWLHWGWKEKYSEEHSAKIWHDYEKIFLDILPNVVKQYDGTRLYWSSSPIAENNEPQDFKSGDVHYWGVWHGKEPFTAFEENTGRFMSEYGFQSFPDFCTVKKYTIEEDWNIESPVMLSHQRSTMGNQLIRTYLLRHYQEPKDFESFLYVSQLLQAKGIAYAIETHRRAKPFCMGSLYWQLNDCWPVASWSSTDYYTRWKALHYKAREAFGEFLVSPLIRGDKVDIYIVSDRVEDLKGELQLTGINFEGYNFYENSLIINIPGNSSSSYLTLDQKDLLKDISPDKSLLRMVLKDSDGHVLSENILYFTNILNLVLEQPEISIEVVKKEKSSEIHLSSDILAKNVYLVLNNCEGHFSDNYFDLMPGEEKIVYLTGTEKTKDIKDALWVRTLWDSYN